MNIQEMIIALEKRGYSLAAIANESEVPPPTISFIKSGARKDVLYSAGKRIEALYNRVTFSTEDKQSCNHQSKSEIS